MSDTTISSYTLTVESQDYNLILNSQDLITKIERVGSQGPTGNSITSAVVNSDADLIITISDSSGNVVETINAGNVLQVRSLDSLEDVTVTSVQDNDILQYDSASSQFVNHSLTTSKVSDIDNTNVADGALMVYNGTSGKYTATTNIDNSNTTIIGGSF